VFFIVLDSVLWWTKEGH